MSTPELLLENGKITFDQYLQLKELADKKEEREFLERQPVDFRLKKLELEDKKEERKLEAKKLEAEERKPIDLKNRELDVKVKELDLRMLELQVGNSQLSSKHSYDSDSDLNSSWWETLQKETVSSLWPNSPPCSLDQLEISSAPSRPGEESLGYVLLQCSPFCYFSQERVGNLCSEHVCRSNDRQT